MPKMPSQIYIRPGEKMNNKKAKNQLELQTIETEQISIETII